MVYEYSELLALVIDALKPLGFRVELDTDYVAVLGNDSSWSVVFEGERYVRPSFDLQIFRQRGTRGEKKFSVRILMSILEDKRVPSLENQLKFLVERGSELMTDRDLWYEGLYDAKNAV